jgi:hypothetical protein
MLLWRRDAKNNDTQNNDTQYNSTWHQDNCIHNDSEHKDTDDYNWTERFEKCKMLLEYQNFILLSGTWWLKF